MKCVEFYRGEQTNDDGYKLEQILMWNNGALEFEHSYIQWLFPSNEPSMMNSDAPVLTHEESQIFQSDTQLQAKIRQSFIRFLDFLDFQLTHDGNKIIIEPKSHLPAWLKEFNHNMLRVTRILKCLRLTGNEAYAYAFYDALKVFSVSANTMGHWYAATFHPLW